MWRCWTTRCCSVAVLTLVASSAIWAQSPVHSPSDLAPAESKPVASAPLSLFPVHTIWTLALNSQLTVPPAYDATRGYFALERQRLVAYDLTTGSRRWLVTANPQMELAVGEELVFLVETATLTALHAADGSVAWKLPLAEKLTVPPVWDNGWLVAATSGHEILAFRASDGELIWRRAIGSAAHARPALAADRVYVPTNDGRIVALRVDTGESIWDGRLGGPANDILALDDRLYVGSNDNFFYCLLTADGAVDWRWRTGADVIGAPVIDGDLVYFVSLDNALRALHRTRGTQRWRASLPVRPIGGPVKAGDVVIVSGVTPSMPAYILADGRAAGDVSVGGEPAAQPHVHSPQPAALPIVIAVSRDIAKGALVSAVAREIEPSLMPLAPLPNLITIGR